ncbi:AcrR family transcriptional regulator [Pedobacter africanus]|uniref:AcrR family transcriptional regulator n=1 Tax=Pedobacter africanus TaxID=151894 RepID=A0ACC6KS29_9SPHI|nr:TetR/AcrR family transcriptional regulator [Pedobacter africanus]MDR6781964.1 AcrR family transcriptional regulator [Pedobacter africanus]
MQIAWTTNDAMTRKTTDGPLRNKERTKNKLIGAVGKILIKEGFTGLNYRQVAAKAKVDRKLIREYFGGLEGLVKAYLNTKDFWQSSSEEIESLIENTEGDMAHAAAHIVIEKQFDSLMSNAEVRSIITWSLCEDLKPLRELNNDREKLAESFFNVAVDDYFKRKNKNLRAVMGILISANYYMTLISHMNGSTICGMDLQKSEDRDEIKKTLRQIIDWTYS